MRSLYALGLLYVALCGALLWAGRPAPAADITQAAPAHGPVTGLTGPEWFQRMKPFCNPVEVETQVRFAPPPAGFEGAGVRRRVLRPRGEDRQGAGADHGAGKRGAAAGGEHRIRPGAPGGRRRRRQVRRSDHGDGGGVHAGQLHGALPCRRLRIRPGPARPRPQAPRAIPGAVPAERRLAEQSHHHARPTRRAMTAPAAPYLSAGTLLGGRYAIERELGRGGYSIVYLARDRSLDADVAVKLLVPPPAAAAVARERMRREVQAVRGLSHGNIVAVHDFGDDGPWSFIVMEYVAGPDLALRVARRGPLGPDEAVRLGREVAAALALAHRHGVIHRDVKPQNILLDPDGRARLTDFGSARLDGVTGVTRTGGLVGTLDYLAPELLAGRRGDGRADLYALGLTLHFALAGRLPERPGAHLPVPASVEGHRPSRIRDAALPRVPAWLDDLVARATMAAPERRLPSAAAMEEALAR